MKSPVNRPVIPGDTKAVVQLVTPRRSAAQDDVIVANGTSCRRQIEDGAGRTALHLAAFLDMALHGGEADAPRPRDPS